MRGEVREKGRPDIGRLISGILGAMERRKVEEGGFFLVCFCFFLEFFGNAERGAAGVRGVTPRIGGRRDVFLEPVAGARRVEGRRKRRQQREQRQEDLRKAAMEAGLTQNEPLSARRFQRFFTFEDGPRHVKREARRLSSSHRHSRYAAAPKISA
ncbi:hypothetical protein [Inquilinus sp. CAU 1745]|uniref:hypothetical protein n=1 Tax=Inquilinus sp. CAU 1745 TaxID=3140369 RepID=UPI00325C14D3